jgi:hypothetical protein
MASSMFPVQPFHAKTTLTNNTPKVDNGRIRMRHLDLDLDLDLEGGGGGGGGNVFTMPFGKL